MRFKYIINCIFIAIIFISGCSNSKPMDNSLASVEWAYEFVVWDGYIYRLTDEFVDNVDKEIGEVTKYLDIEGSYAGNFSNVYEKGTKYYALLGVSKDEAIAIKEKGKYRKAIRDGKYGEK